MCRTDGSAGIEDMGDYPGRAWMVNTWGEKPGRAGDADLSVWPLKVPRGQVEKGASSGETPQLLQACTGSAFS